MVIDFENRRKRKTFEENVGKERLTTQYAKGEFVIKVIEEGGKVTLTKNNTDYKILMDYPTYKKYTVGDTLKCMLSKKVFYVYWNLEFLL